MLINTAQLHNLIEHDRTVRVLDVRWSLGEPNGTESYTRGHIPGSVFVDLETELAGPGTPSDGRHPLPSVSTLERAARTWGLANDSTVVVYDDIFGLAAARAWWLLTAHGVMNVRLLDGGYGAWVRDGFAVEVGAPRSKYGSITFASRELLLPVITTKRAASFPKHGTLIDSRAPERFNGAFEPIDKRAGHVPGAVNVPASENVDNLGSFLPPEALRARFQAASIDVDGKIAVYCGSGVTAAHNIFALHLIGARDVSLWPGSWSAWANDPKLPAVIESMDENVAEEG